MYFFLKTISDVGFKRITLRFRYEIRKKIDAILGPSLALRICKTKNKRPIWINSIKNFQSFNINPFINEKYSKKIKFVFLNEARLLSTPIEWNNKNWPRLWQFNLHYFDWIRIIIDYYLDTNKILKSYGQVEIIIDEWITSNLPGIGDGWHSYTISQRIRNWIWLLRVFPVLVDEKKINSIWDQVLWLESHPEECHGGNHWLENLISLSLASLQFQGKDSQRILKSSLQKLNIELKNQILDDGGHEERTASYHVVILDKLVELACFLQILESQRPFWLVQNIKKMSKWLESILLDKNILPRFNDSALNACPPPEDVLKFANSYLDKINYSNSGIRLILINLIKKKKNCQKLIIQKKELIDLPCTGWTIVRLGKFWEFTFKNGISCPKHLPAHAHSDLLSFDIFYKGLPVIAEAGTSIYENGAVREFERSGKSHNILQLAPFKGNTFSKKKIKWIEPIEVWDSFRAARKANIINRSAKKIKKDFFQISGSHDGFKKYGAFHERYINIKNNKIGDIDIEFIEKISCSRPMWVRLCLHLGPNLSKLLLKGLNNIPIEQYNFTNNWDQTFFAYGFGKRKIRKSLYSIGFLSPGMHELRYGLIIKSKDL